MKTKSNITEKKLTKAELEAREKVIKDLKKNKSALVKRYGKDAEAVMYGRATNIAKKMAESENKNRIKELVRKSLMQEADIEVDADRYKGEQELGQVSMMMDELESLLKGFDWYYFMSDDPRVYRNGSAYDNKVSSLVKQLKDLGYGDDAKKLYNQYAPDGDINLKMKEGKKEDVDGDGDIDSKDYLAKRDAAIKKAKGELKEYQAPEDLVRFLQKQGVKINLQEPYTYKDIKDALKALGLEGKFDDLMPQNFTITMPDVPKGMFEDIDLGHEDNEPHMVKADLYRIGKYAMELYAIADKLEETGQEIDFPAWWQSMITDAASKMVKAKHYLDFELKEPAIDAAVDTLTGKKPYMSEPEPPMMEGEVTKVDKLAGKITKALKDPKNKAADDQNNIKQARKAMNNDKIETAEKIIKPYLAEKIAKQLKSK